MEVPASLRKRKRVGFFEEKADLLGTGEADRRNAAQLLALYFADLCIFPISGLDLQNNPTRLAVPCPQRPWQE